MRLSALVPAILLLCLSTAGLAAVLLQPPRGPGVSLAVLYPPGTTLVEAMTKVAAQGGRVERAGKWENLIVASFDTDLSPVDALKDTGAWLVFDPILAGGCGLLKAEHEAFAGDARET